MRLSGSYHHRVISLVILFVHIGYASQCEGTFILRIGGHIK